MHSARSPTTVPVPRRSPLFLSIFNSFGPGGAQTRFVQLANFFSGQLRHIIVSRDGTLSSLDRLTPQVEASAYPWRLGSSYLQVHRSVRAALLTLCPQRLLTHNWGTIDWAIANTLHRIPHIHFEDGFGADEADGPKSRRNLARRLVLGHSEVVVPSLTLRHMAQARWGIAPHRLHFIPNGIDCSRFAPGERADGALDRERSQFIVGTVAALRPEKNVARLIAAFATLRRSLACNLVIVGDGPERPKLRSLAAELGVSEHVEFVGHVTDAAPYYRKFDAFALASDTEQMPYTVLEAMASGCCVVATDVGDVRAVVSAENDPFIVGRDPGQLASACAALLANRDLRGKIGLANAQKARADFDQRQMFRRYAQLFGIAEDEPLPE